MNAAHLFLSSVLKSKSNDKSEVKRMGTKRICIDVPSELAMADEIRIRLKCKKTDSIRKDDHNTEMPKRYMGKKQEGGSFR